MPANAVANLFTGEQGDWFIIPRPMAKEIT